MDAGSIYAAEARILPDEDRSYKLERRGKQGSTGILLSMCGELSESSWGIFLESPAVRRRGGRD